MTDVEISDNALKIMLRRIREELTIVELFAYDFYFAPRDNPENDQHPCVCSPDNPAFTYQQNADYRRLLEAIRKIETLSGGISARL